MDEIRTALEYARNQLGVERVLLSKELRVMIGNLFLQHRDRLINVGKGGQEAMPEILQAYLERIERDVRGVPTRMYPLTRFDYRNAPRFVKA